MVIRLVWRITKFLSWRSRISLIFNLTRLRWRWGRRRAHWWTRQARQRARARRRPKIPSLRPRARRRRRGKETMMQSMARRIAAHKVPDAETEAPKRKKAKGEFWRASGMRGKQAKASEVKQRFILFVGNLKYTTTAEAIKAHFAACDPPPTVRPTNPETFLGWEACE
ncbi:hypothetical protein B0H11DRAFT_378137 [Mycena galericulata]|nr:hypothetical protein B0H11DRAFT_378137 [Mycena galericulata]